MMALKAVALAAVFVATTAQAATPTASYLIQASPTYFNSIPQPTGVITSWPVNTPIPTGNLTTGFFTNYSFPGFPEENQIVTNATSDPNIIAAMANIDWTKVPDAPVTTTAMLTTYNASDPYCWWTYSTCVTPKIDYIPPDLYICPTPGTWGLTYDDGPLFFWPSTPENAVWAEPNLYNYLEAHDDQKANLMYIGSNILGAPDAAQRGLNDGHVICCHTWSHPSMTQLTNAEVVAEFYYCLKMIKTVLGITPRCWRPPYGDVDDRVRSIAWQMGMRTIIWDLDTNDWDIPGDQTPGGDTPYSVANATFAGWIENREKGNDTKTGHICLEHELSNSTIALAEFWLPYVQKNYQTMPATSCNNIAQPYWEDAFVYPIQGTVAVGVNGTATGLKLPGSNGTTTGSSANPSSSVSTSSAHSGAAHAAELSIFFLGAVVAAAAGAHGLF
ncbi:hypothetical protein EMPS_01479 [Entomortierella parvispora]|uniref:NodB homology domain-containing protein n=1 Tax=Entomortierella parvispora TaxID=205924 RepID=A0A9P3H3M8_9FUNG|nr:hypothetical protein EMPS_01479 [Entomortierella parvispora]